MNRIEIKKFLEQYTNEVPIFPSKFPLHMESGYMFEFSGNTIREETVSETQLIIYARAPDIGSAEKLALDLKKELKQITDVFVGETHVILMRAIGKHADYGGNDESDRHYFITRYTMLLDDKMEDVPMIDKEEIDINET